MIYDNLTHFLQFTIIYSAMSQINQAQSGDRFQSFNTTEAIFWSRSQIDRDAFFLASF